MISLYIAHFARRHLPWLAADAAVVAGALALAWAARFITADYLALPPPPAFLFGLVAIALFCSVNYGFRLYHRIWRYASAAEVVAIGSSVAVSTALLMVDALVWPGGRPVPLSVVLMMGFFAFAGFVAVRYRRRLWTGLDWRWRAVRGELPRRQVRTLIVGAGESGQLLAWRLLHQAQGDGYRLVGFVDDDPSKRGMRVHGVPVLGNRHDLPALAARHRVELIVIAIYEITSHSFQHLLELCESTPARIKVLPNLFDFIQGTNGAAHIRDVTAEDLLGRKPVAIDREACRGLVAGKRVLVTGAAGSIGSELCRQILRLGPERLLMLDNNETGLYDLELELRLRKWRPHPDALPGGEGVFPPTPHLPFPEPATRDPQPPLPGEMVPIVADVTAAARMERVFGRFRPQVVFHAAAYKHVPLMEEHPEEAVRVNVLGSWVVSGLAARYGAERFVLVSTDKAINPSSVMGATKRLAEMLAVRGDGGTRGRGDAGTRGGWGIGLGRDGGGSRGTRFTAVRFGNVLGSRGSVVPTFERQIDGGGPVTVTHPEMTRYFMTISEAVSLILQAATLTEGGDLFMLEMGQRIGIDALARRLIRLRGLRPELDLPIVYTGVRPGEKMHEELLGQGEERHPTAHPKIQRLRCPTGPDRAALERQVDGLLALLVSGQEGEIAARLREIAASPADRPSAV